MRKLLKRIGICFLLVCLVWCGTLIADRQRLRQELIRLHVVANSDSEEDQSLKLRVRDAVVESLQQGMADVTDTEQAKAYLQENLPKIENLANQVLAEAGCSDTVQVSLDLEEFGTRVYDTFTLPAGIYESLRIIIGAGEGKNWWCVVFPSLCIPATSEGFEDTAAGAGFPESLTGALEGEEGYEVRFFLLDALGSLENLIHKG
ncbi:MAG: stage II sporulation protein R [Oscillospiraceae bacterium]|nr:stage II sporulation protein R [Oscillospiraceae bacterium]